MQDDAEPKRVQGRQQGADRDALRGAIAQEEALFAKLEAEQTQSKHRLTILRAELTALDTEPEIRVRLPVSPRAPIPRTSADKVRLFRSLFRGREDGELETPNGRRPPICTVWQLDADQTAPRLITAYPSEAS
jgi:hypothetical protein